jgi:glucosamine kinase
VTRRLGIDVGGSATRWHLTDHINNTEIFGETNGFSGHISKPDILILAKQAINTIARQAGPAEAIVAGVTGLSRNTDEAVHLSFLLERAFSASSVLVMSDIELAARAAFPFGEGILIYAGTGSIAAHMTDDGQLVTAGGKGVLIDDAGGGYWIAVTALRAILRAEDIQQGTGWSTPLGETFANAFGGTPWPVVRSAFYARNRGEVAMLALCVGEAARLGDQAALAVLRSAGQELALLATMLTNRIGPKPIVLAGRAALLHGIVLESMIKALPDTLIVQKDLMLARTAAKFANSHHIFNPHNG